MGIQHGWPDLTSMFVYLCIAAFGMGLVAFAVAEWDRSPVGGSLRTSAAGFALMAFVLPYAKIATVNGWLIPGAIAAFAAMALVGKWGARGFP